MRMTISQSKRYFDTALICLVKGSGLTLRPWSSSAKSQSFDKALSSAIVFALLEHRTLRSQANGKPSFAEGFFYLASVAMNFKGARIPDVDTHRPAEG
ncbi:MULTISPECIES: hypothetical protein [Agrobacterium]|uniref:Uncharacterized protein n=1 Tax=Agrobacterium tumefaciens TaxID=358 RepID=A0AAE6EGY6_AGRTU|nr:MULTISPECIES: hypothetical protein [Agrobacterium]QCL75864.1 hypothetical protein CFBP5499_20600 [Agrobacterium tumefaciens]QCL81423.1 hypothetical protein CFBP5877_20125 [Agrobacterium tumefaciens]WCK04725.1 hypothetical protein G6L31_019085 [Agrobacterium tumefaciens]